jgi:thymidylate synthase ThyX
MGQLVTPRVHLIGYSVLDMEGVSDYLRETGQQEFLADIMEARAEGISDAEIMCSLYAKMCYKSLVTGKNSNITRTRGIRGNLEGCHDTGHGSVFEHVNLNFIVRDCSRVYTHEQVRHRQGWAYSQTSGRFCRLDTIDLVWSDLLDPVQELWMEHLGRIEDLVYLTECKLGLRKPPGNFTVDEVPYDLCLPVTSTPVDRQGELVEFSKAEDAAVSARTDPACYFHHDLRDNHSQPFSPEHQVLADKLAKAAEQDNWAMLETPEDVAIDRALDAEVRAALRWVPDNSFDFDKRKAITSAIRRIAPNGQANEIGMSVNIRALRHTVQLRTQRHAETEIRDVFGQVYDLVKERFPTIFYKAKTRMFGKYREVYGMRLQPYEIEAGDPKALEFWDTADLRKELSKRDLAEAQGIAS